MTDPVALLADLVAIDTTSRRSNLGLLDLVEDRLAALGAETRRIPNGDGTKANLLARLGPAVEGGVVLSAHTDCVPVEGQPWSADPFRLREADGRLHGRGTADMKGFVAVTLAALERTRELDLERPVLLALSYDEELGTLGAPSLVEALRRHEPPPAAALVGEPTGLRIVGAHKGVRSFTTVVTGRDAHSSQPQRAANAVAAAARIAAFIDDLALELRAAGGDPRFDPPYTTFNVATIAGGQAINIVPRRCELTWEYRPVPADDSDELRRRVEAYAATEVLARLRETAAEAGVDTAADAVVPALAMEEGNAAEQLVRRLTGDDRPAGTVAYGTDGGHFQRAGIPTVVYGPGSIDQAHQPDEYLERTQLEDAARFLDALLEDLAR